MANERGNGARNDGVELALAATLTDLEKTVRVSAAELTHAGGVAGERTVPLASSPAAPESLVAVGPVCGLGAFEDQGEIGRGGMGAVHMVKDRRLLRTMALKALSRQCTPDAAPARRFVEEAQITGQLDHPNIVPVHELGRAPDGGLYFTMKLVRGKTLSEILAELGAHRVHATNLERLVGILIKVCDAVAFAHSRGVVHRDLKPSNVMVGSFGQVYVVDWGIAYLRDDPRPEPVGDPEEGEEQMLGTPPYMAPEQARNRGMDERTDVYGIGGILYSILTAQVPHPGGSFIEIIYHAVKEPVIEPAVAAPDLALPPELCRIAMTALAMDPAERYPSVTLLRADLERFLRGGGWLGTRHFVAGELLMREGDPAEEAYVITAGSCEAYKSIAGRRERLRRMGPGEVVGETSLLTGRTRTANVVAVEPVAARVVTRESLERELERNTWMRALFHGLAERFRDLDASLTDKLRGGG